MGFRSSFSPLAFAIKDQQVIMIYDYKAEVGDPTQQCLASFFSEELGNRYWVISLLVWKPFSVDSW